MNVIVYIPFVLLLGLGLDIYIPSIPHMLLALNISDPDVQLTLSGFMLTYGFGQLFFGPVAPRMGFYRTLVFSTLIFSVGSITCAIASELSMLLVGRILQAFGACGAQVVTLSIIRQRYHAHQAAGFLTIIKVSMSIAPIFAPIIGAYLQTHFNWRASFIFLMCYGVGVFLLACALGCRHKEMRSSSNSIVHDVQVYCSILRSREFLVYCFAAVTAQAQMFAHFSLSPRFYISQYGLSEQSFALLFALNSIAFFLVGASGIRLISTWGQNKLILFASGLYVLAGIMIAFGQAWFDSYFVLFLPNFIASGASALMLSAATVGALTPFKPVASYAAALLGCIEFIVGGSLGSVVVYQWLPPIICMSVLMISLPLLAVVLLNWDQKERVKVDQPYRDAPG